MSYPTKIATCCYCGTRAALVLKGKVQHELACSACGAPLHNLKKLPTDRPKSAERELIGGAVFRDRADSARNRSEKPRKAKRRKVGGWGRKLLEEIWDEVEDIFD